MARAEIGNLCANKHDKRHIIIYLLNCFVNKMQITNNR